MTKQKPIRKPSEYSRIRDCFSPWPLIALLAVALLVLLSWLTGCR